MNECRKSLAILIAVMMMAVIAFPVDASGQQRGRGRRGRGNTQPPVNTPTPPRAQTRSPARGPVTPQIVVITKKDNSTARGTIVSADPDHVVIQPSLRPDEDVMPAQMTIDWKEIQRISNGMTRAKLLAEWKLEHLDNLCETCHGNRTLYCTTCKGTGHDVALLLAVDCRTCQGELLLECSVARCDAGMIPCTNTCLKLSEGQWFRKDDGLRYRRFPLPNGSFVEFSERNVGELIAHNANNMWVSQGRCSTCGGRSTLDDPVCQGYGKIPCATCVARKDAGDCANKCEAGLIVCVPCKGSGLKSAEPAPTSPQARRDLQDFELLHDIELLHDLPADNTLAIAR